MQPTANQSADPVIHAAKGSDQNAGPEDHLTRITGTAQTF